MTEQVGNNLISWGRSLIRLIITHKTKAILELVTLGWPGCWNGIHRAFWRRPWGSQPSLNWSHSCLGGCSCVSLVSKQGGEWKSLDKECVACQSEANAFWKTILNCSGKHVVCVREREGGEGGRESVWVSECVWVSMCVCVCTRSHVCVVVEGRYWLSISKQKLKTQSTSKWTVWALTSCHK